MTEREDIAKAVSLMSTKFGGKREIKRLPDHLHEGELVHRICTGSYGGGQGILVLTDRRLLFLKDGMMKQTSEDLPFDRIGSIQWSSGLATGKVQATVAGNKVEVTSVAKADGKALVDDVRTRLSGAASAAPGSAAAPAPAVVVDEAEQLRKLAELRDAGILTEEEFSAKKAQILGL